jgi:hypothetical protein
MSNMSIFAVFVGWVERSATHRSVYSSDLDGLRFASPILQNPFIEA